ncbi:MAG: AAA family ATPase [Pseudomonadota bacterium]
MYSLEEAKKYLEALDEFASEFTFQTFDDTSNNNKTLCRILNGPIKDHWETLVELNSQGAGIYVTVNETDLKGRSSKNIIAPRAFYLDDDDGITEPQIKPNMIVYTSESKRHLYWFIDSSEWTLQEYKILQRQFVHQCKADKNAVDIARVLRIPGLYNMKDPQNPYLVHADFLGYNFIRKADFLKIVKPEPTSLRQGKVKNEYTQSDLENVRNALEFVSSDDRSTWIDFGIALKNDFDEDGFEVWDDWSRQSSKYVNGECEEKWKEFSGKGDIHIASIFYLAKKNGYVLSNIPHPCSPDEDFGVFYETDLSVQSASDFEGKALPIQKFVINDFLIAGAPASLYGDPGVGKSTVALQICSSIALGRDFMGFETNQSKCLILSCEDDLDEMHRRLSRICKEHGYKFKDFKNNLLLCCRAGNDNVLVNYPGQGNPPINTDLYEDILSFIKNENIEFLVIDNIANVFGGNENDRTEATQFMSPIYKLCVELGITVLLLGHPPKNKISASYSGSTAWEASVRQRFNLKNEDDDTFVFICEKANYIRVGKEVEMYKNADGIFVEAFSSNDSEDDFDFDGLKAKIWNFVRECNQNDIAISFAHQAGNDYYEKKLAFKGLTKGHKIKDIHLAVEELAKEGKLTKKPKTAKMIAVKCV